MKKKTMFTMLTAAAITTALLSNAMTAFAANMNNASNGVLTTNENTLTFQKDIVVHNEDTSVTSVYGPTVSYTYAIAAAEVGTETSIKDSGGNVSHVKAGIPAAVSFTDNQAEFTTAAVALTGGDGVVSDDVALSFTPSAFGAAGIYRYKITETHGDLTAACITRSAHYSADRYLDVYVENDAGGELKISAYVMFHDADTTSFDATDNTSGNTEKKTDGYDADDDSTSTDPTGGGDMADHYYTYNYSLKKEITGGLADKTHQFPFTIETTGFVTTYSVEKSAQNATAPETGTVGTDLSVALANDGTVRLVGLPANATVKVTETNDTPDTYKTSAANPTVAQASVESGRTLGFDAAVNLTDYATNQTAEPGKDTALGTETVFTNELASISPTGVVLAVAPYAIMLAAAAFFILMFAKNRKKDESVGTI